MGTHKNMDISWWNNLTVKEQIELIQLFDFLDY